MGFFVGTDVGGTFTDLWVSASDGRTRVFKSPTTKDVLGGVLDATNVIERPLLSVIAPVDYDHAEFLGTDLAGIAAENYPFCTIEPNVGIVEVPNYAAQRAAGRVADYVADHLSYFTSDALRAMLTVSGFELTMITS